ncbi:hypothetical protein CYMTET_56079 [Cymbomonas tetramitiformis]|uniref:Uncharacterized protein n=1 Tax=Cymbomonas tetramitiformis TaxID=36881 RepID=A0AAE0BC03_9CHLO|nr:hypothetical protein CYMTET_56079 [Cymbomonas tetramitiformis]
MDQLKDVKALRCSQMGTDQLTAYPQWILFYTAVLLASPPSASSPGKDTSDDDDVEADLSFQLVSHLPAAPQSSGGLPAERTAGSISVTHAQLGQPEQPQQVVQSIGGAPLRCCNRQEHPPGPFYTGTDGLSYSAFPGGTAPADAPVGANSLALTGGASGDYGGCEAASDVGEDDRDDDREFEEFLAADRAAYASGKVVDAAPAAGGRACGVGHFALASFMPRPSPRLLDALADSLTVPLDPDIMTAYRRGFLAALRLRDSLGTVPGAGGTTAGDALQAVVQPPGSEVRDATAEDEDGDEDAAAAGSRPADKDI